MKKMPIQVRVSASEKQAFQEAAKISSLSLSSWIRANLRRAAIKDLEDVGQIAVFLIEGEENGQS